MAKLATSSIGVKPSNAGATFIQSTRTQRFLKTLSCWYSLESSHWVLSDEYPHARVSVIFQLFCIILYCPNYPAVGLRRIWLQVAKSAWQVWQTFDIIDYAQMSITDPICKTTIKTFRKIILFALNPAKIWVKNMNIFDLLLFPCQLRVMQCFGALILNCLGAPHMCLACAGTCRGAMLL